MNRHEKYFWSKVDKKKSYECWNWTGGKSNGYGSFGIYEDGKVTGFKAHRYAYELSRRCRIPENMLICHLCDNPLCVNPSHLYCGTGEDNARDRSKNDIIRSTKISLSKAKFYSGEIWLIRRLKNKFPSRYIAKIFKCDKGTILNIWRSSIWPCKEGYYA